MRGGLLWASIDAPPAAEDAIFLFNPQFGVVRARAIDITHANSAPTSRFEYLFSGEHPKFGSARTHLSSVTDEDTLRLDDLARFQVRSCQLTPSPSPLPTPSTLSPSPTPTLSHTLTPHPLLFHHHPLCLSPLPPISLHYTPPPSNHIFSIRRIAQRRRLL